MRLNAKRIRPIAFDNFTPRFIDGERVKPVPVLIKDDTTFIGSLATSELSKLMNNV